MAAANKVHNQWRIAKMYDSKSLEKRLEELPVVFHGISDSLSLISELLIWTAGNALQRNVIHNAARQDCKIERLYFKLSFS